VAKVRGDVALGSCADHATADLPLSLRSHALARELRTRRGSPKREHDAMKDEDGGMKMKTKTSKSAKKKTTPRAKAKKKPKTAYEKVGAALASTASFAVSVARGTEDRIRDLAAAVTSHPETDPAPRATDLLISQHRLVEKLLDRVESANGSTASLLGQIADNLAAHIAIEEQLFYPAVRKLDNDIILEGLEEHAMGRFALKRLLATRAKDASLKARLKALQELMVNHHKEEENDLFPKVNRSMSNDALRALGTKMKALFDAEMKRGHEAVLATFDDVPGRAARSTPAKKRTPARAAAGN
jgi:hemerythrin superfamily protein